MELITSILSEEVKTLNQTPITDISENSWTTAESRNSHRQTMFQSSSAVNLIHKFPVTNRYTVLSNYHESQERDDWSSLPFSEQRSNHKPINTHKKVGRPRIKKTVPMNQPRRPMNHQSHEFQLQESAKNEDWVSPIPTIVNGVTNSDCNAKFSRKYNDKIQDTVSKLTETIIACNKNAEFLHSLLPNTPQVICLTEHHLRIEEIVNVNLSRYTLGAKFCRQTYSLLIELIMYQDGDGESV